MIRAAQISIGNELLSGQVLDTNAVFLARALCRLGMPLVGRWIVQDCVDAIKAALEWASAQAQVVILTGGLGPTQDDLTRQALACYLGVDLELREDLLAQIRAFFEARGRQMCQANQVQAMLPRGCEPLANPIGTAPGIMCRRVDRLVIAMPGVPAEVEQMFALVVEPILAQLPGRSAVATRRIHCFGQPESAVAQQLQDLMARGRNPSVDSTACNGMVTITITAWADAAARADFMVHADEQVVRARLGRLVFGADDQTLAGVVGQSLTRLGKTVAVAESCTGGLLAKLLTDQAGASRYLIGGYVVYDAKAKLSALGISEGLLAQHGTVSGEMAGAMAGQVRVKLGSDYGLSVTGVAGPDQVEGMPVGTVYVGLDGPDGLAVRGLRLFGDRQAVRMRAAMEALNELRLRVQF